MRWAWVFVIVATLAGTPAQADSPTGWMLKLTLRGRPIEGEVLHWDESRVYLLARDGRLWDFAPGEPRDFQKTANRFRSYSTSEFRALLLRELGEGFEVSGTSHYLVAHARGQHDQWAQRFEDLYRSFVHYFSVRGFRLSEPVVPLVGIVCRSREDFDRYTAKQGISSGGILGYYSMETNRIVIYDMGVSSSSDWQETAKTLIHEAAHQTAFNTGIHSRYTMPPRWVGEGLATMFEAPGVYDSRRFSERNDRINRGRLRDFQQAVVPNHRPEILRDLVARDNLFRVAPAVAYAEAWALTFYLTETQPRKYADYLARTVAHPVFADYSASERIADFTAVFGTDWRMLEAQFLRFMADVK